MKIEYRPLDAIIPYADNAKKHEVSWILNSIRLGLPEGLSPEAEHEYIVNTLIDQPIVVDADGVIIKGHGRLKAARELGLTEFPVVRRDDLTPEQVRLARIADNRSQEGGWDADKLSQELAALSPLFDDVTFDGLGLTEEWGASLGAAWGLTPKFEPTSEEEQPRLDQKQPIICPNCGYEFIKKS